MGGRRRCCRRRCGRPGATQQSGGEHRSGPAGAARPARKTHRGGRAGWRHQLRRRGVRRPVGITRSPCAYNRCLAYPPRLSTKRTAEAYRCPVNSRQGGGGRQQGQSARPPLKIAHLNVRSLMPSIDDVNYTLQTMDIDILCLGETWLNENIDSSFLVFPGYKVIRRDRPAQSGRRRGGGVCVIVRDAVRAETLTTPTGDSLLESLWISIRSTTTAVIGVVYRPPSAPVTAALDDLQAQLTHVICTGKPIFALGDVNFDALQPAKADVHRYLQMISAMDMKQLVTGPTRPASGTLIDHVLVRSSDDVTATRVEPCSWSDHDLVIAETTLQRERRRPAEVTIRSTRDLVPDALCLDLLVSD